MTQDRDDRKGRFDWLTLGAAALTIVLMARLALMSAFAQSSWGGAVSISDDDIRQYWFSAGFIIAIQVALLLRAIAVRRSGLVVLSSAVVAFAVLFSLAFSLPPIDLRPDPPTYTTPPGYEPCYSGSGDCKGG